MFRICRIENMKLTSGKDYTQYTFEEFLSDDYFINSMGNPGADDTAFWEKFQQSNSSNLKEFTLAKSYIQSIPVNKDSLTDSEVADLWNNIQQANNRKRYLTNRRKRLLLASISVAAACIIGVLFIPSFFKISPSPESDIYSFVSEREEVDFDSSSARLILSEDKTLLLDEKESVIVYDSVSIKVSGNKEDLSKNETASYNQLIVPKGKRSTLTLADGTKVWVNAGTRVIYPVEFNSKERELYVDGEIYIQVAHNKDWPFVVKTKDIGINVLGTEFNVTAYESDEMKRIVLVSGSIRLINKNDPKDILLTPHKMYQYYNNVSSVQTVDISKYISWKDGMYIFENERLDIIFERLSHYYGADIDYDANAATLRCSGKLDLKNNLTDVLKGLTYTAPILFENRNEKYIIKHKP